MILVRKTEFGKVTHQNIRVEDPHHELLAKSCRQGRQTQFGLTPFNRSRLDSTILRTPFFDDVHTAKNLDATGHRIHHRHRDLIHLMQHAIDTKTNQPQITSRLNVNIAGALFKSVQPEPINDIDDMLIIGVELPVGATQLDQLLK